MSTSDKAPGHPDEKNRRKLELFGCLAALFVLGISILSLYSAKAGFVCDATGAPRLECKPFLEICGSVLMLGLAALGAGALIGFLFGVPRYKTEQSVPATSAETSSISQSERAQFKPNTNLEEISDWLTKLFVGATLVELSKIPNWLARLGTYFSVVHGDEHVAVSAAIYFAILGFFIAFFYARLDFTETLNMPSSLAMTFQARGPLAERSTEQTLSGKEGESLIDARIALADSMPAATVSSDVSEKDIEFAVQELRKLAARYEEIRDTMGPGDARTIKMEGIVAQMKLIAPIALDKITLFQNSVIAGERLACIVMLQLKPDISFLRWLVDRFRGERPFVQYHASLALRSAGRQLTGQTDAILKAVDTALEILRPSVSETSDRVRMLKQTKEELESRTGRLA